MRILITTGPSYAPIDYVRRITNFATGQIGTLLTRRLLADGHNVFLARGEGCTAPAPESAPGLVVETFGTNDDLDELLKEWAHRHAFDAVLHAAALGDFRVKEIHMPQESELFNDKDTTSDPDLDESIFDDEDSDAAQEIITDKDSNLKTDSSTNFKDKPDAASPLPSKMPAKIGSETKVLHIILTPAKKLLPMFRQRFGPQTRIVGWKYELDGDREAALAKGHRQMEKCGSDASVVNGRAYGDGFGVCLPGGTLHHCTDKEMMADWLAQWLGSGV